LEKNANEEYIPNVEILNHGMKYFHAIQRDFFLFEDYKQLGRFANSIRDLINRNSYVMKGDRKKEIDSFENLVSWLLEEAKRGQSIQRYKGLGEMNPEQLWETTMDPDNRRLLQVTVEDAVAADEMFTILMGDEV